MFLHMVVQIMDRSLAEQAPIVLLSVGVPPHCMISFSIAKSSTDRFSKVSSMYAHFFPLIIKQYLYLVDNLLLLVNHPLRELHHLVKIHSFYKVILCLGHFKIESP